MHWYLSDWFLTESYTVCSTLSSFFCLCVCIVCFPVLSPCPAAATRRCHSIYKGFAQCLMALGDSLTDSARKDEDTHEIFSICRSVCGHRHVVPHYTHTQTLLKNPEALSHINRKSTDFEIYFSKPHRAVIGIFCYFGTEGLEIRQKLSRDSTHCLYSLCKAFRKKSFDKHFTFFKVILLSDINRARSGCTSVQYHRLKTWLFLRTCSHVVRIVINKIAVGANISKFWIYCRDWTIALNFSGCC